MGPVVQTPPNEGARDTGMGGAAVEKCVLTQREAVAFLLHRKLVGPADIVAGTLSVTDISRRHLGYKVSRSSASGFVLKQGLGFEKTKAIEREAAMYRLLGKKSTALSPYLPRFVDYDADRHVLVLELVGQGQNLRDYHAQRGHFSVTLAREAGNALAALHSLEDAGPDDARTAPQTGQSSSQFPWVLNLHRPRFKFVQECSNANLQLIRTIQQFPEFGDLLDMQRKDWRMQTLIHNDMRWDNCIVFGKSPSGRTNRLKMIDWEIAGLGDPYWDIGSVFNDYLSFWLLSIPVTGEMPPDHFLKLARHPLEKMHPAFNAFWDSYVRQTGMDATHADQSLLRSVRYAGVRLLQTAFEQMQSSTRLTGNMYCILQLSLNILQRPLEATVQLLGMPLQDMWRS